MFDVPRVVTCVRFLQAAQAQATADATANAAAQAAQDSFNAVEANHAWDQRTAADAQANNCTRALCMHLRVHLLICYQCTPAFKQVNTDKGAAEYSNCANAARVGLPFHPVSVCAIQSIQLNASSSVTLLRTGASCSRGASFKSKTANCRGGVLRRQLNPGQSGRCTQFGVLRSVCPGWCTQRGLLGTVDQCGL